MPSIKQVLDQLPARPEHSFPLASQDGGGAFSVPDWTFPPRQCPDVSKPLRQGLHSLFAQWKLPLRLRRHVLDSVNAPLLTEREVQICRTQWQLWFQAQGFSDVVDWRVDEGQPYTLRALRLLAQALEDKDTALWDALESGVPTGVSRDIPPSKCFLPAGTSSDPDDVFEFQVCAGNWPGAVEHPELLAEMVQAEIDAGYLEVWRPPKRAGLKWQWARSTSSRLQTKSRASLWTSLSLGLTPPYVFQRGLCCLL